MSDGTKDRINDDSYWYKKHSEVVEELKKLEAKIKKLEKKLRKKNE
jgi:hypothetical protein